MGDLIGGVILGFVLGLVVLACAIDNKHECVRRELAIEQGYGEFVMDKDSGRSSFVWILKDKSK